MLPILFLFVVELSMAYGILLPCGKLKTSYAARFSVFPLCPLGFHVILSLRQPNGTELSRGFLSLGSSKCFLTHRTTFGRYIPTI